MTIDSAVGLVSYQQQQVKSVESRDEKGVVVPMKASIETQQQTQGPSEEVKKMVAQSVGVGGTLNVSV